MPEFYAKRVSAHNPNVNIAMSTAMYADRINHSQIRLGNVQDSLPRVESIVDESVEVLRDPQLPKYVTQSWRHADGWSPFTPEVWYTTDCPWDSSFLGV